jgi:hypothetical protein
MEMVHHLVRVSGYYFMAECSVSVSTLWYACRELNFKSQGGNFSSLVNKVHELSFGCKEGDQDKMWSSYL